MLWVVMKFELIYGYPITKRKMHVYDYNLQLKISCNEHQQLKIY